MNFEYDVVDTQYGEKLCIFWDDGNYPDGIKRLSWDDTHRSMYNPNWDDADEKIVHGKVDRSCWYIDWTPRAISLFENLFDTYVPSEYRPDERDGDELHITVPEGHAKFSLERPPHEVDRILDAELSYEAPNAEYTRAYKNGTWDGIVHIYDKQTHSAPLGLLDRCVALLEREGYDVTVDIEDSSSAADIIHTTWNEDIEPRPYQQAAIDAVKENEGGVVSLPTGTGKTITALKLIHDNRMSRGRAIVFVHTQELLYQWADEVREHLDVEPGLIGDGQWSEGPVTIAIMQTLHSRGTQDLEHSYGQIIFDECHRTSAAETFHEIGMELDCQYRIGLSATPWRRISGEELYIEGAIGGVAHEVDAESMIEKGYLTRPFFDVIDPAEYGDQREASYGMDYPEAMETCIEMDPIRSLAIAKKAHELAEMGHKVLINVNRVAQGRIIASALNADMEPSDVASGLDAHKRRKAMTAADTLGTVADHGALMVSSNTDDRGAILDEFENGDLDIIASTLLKEGVDIPDISAIILAHGQKSDIETIQTIGRALRPSDIDHAQIVDVKDRGMYFNDAFKVRQQTMRDYYGKFYDLDVEPPETKEKREQVDLSEPMSKEEEDQLMEDFGL